MNVRDLLRDGLSCLRGHPVAVGVALLLAEVGVALLLAPITAWSARWLVGRSGRHAVTNEDLLGFAFSVHGVLTLLLVAISWIVGGSLVRAGVMLACEARGAGPSAGVRAAMRALSRVLVLIELAARQALALGMIVLPWLGALAFIAWITLRGVDPNWLVSARPPRFWIGAACATPVLLAAAWLGVRRILMWSIALPRCLLEQQSPAQAMSSSREALRDELRPILLARLAWFLGASMLGVCVLAIVHEAGEAILRREFSTLLRTALAAGAVLAVSVVAAAAVSALHAAGDAAICFAVWRRLLDPGLEGPRPSSPVEASALGPARLRVAIVSLLGAMALSATLVSLQLLTAARRPLAVELSAHRGDELHAPENTLAAIESAIAVGADRVEIDVMRTRDNQLVLSHDTDLRRLARDPRRIRDLTLDELRQVDVGTWFGPQFAGERMPTLREVLDRARGRVALNIEIKAAGDEDRVATLVAAALRDEPGGRLPAAPIIVTSLSAGVLQSFRRELPSVPSGMIVSVAVGSLHQMDADLFSLEARLATDVFLASARAAGKPVHVWGVRDVDQFTRFALRGVDGVIAADVRPFRQRLAELSEMDDAERLLLAFRARLLE